MTTVPASEIENFCSSLQAHHTTADWVASLEKTIVGRLCPKKFKFVSDAGEVLNLTLFTESLRNGSFVRSIMDV
jgi:hypothetical protein